MQCQYFKKNRGDCPVLEYVLKQEENEQDKIFQIIDLFEELGHQHFLRTKDAKPIDKNNRIFELKVKRHRLIYTFIDSVCWFLHAFTKKSNKTPRREIKQANNIKKQLIIQLS